MEKSLSGPAGDRAEDLQDNSKVAAIEFKPCECGFGWSCWNDSSICGFFGCFECPRWG